MFGQRGQAISGKTLMLRIFREFFAAVAQAGGALVGRDRLGREIGAEIVGIFLCLIRDHAQHRDGHANDCGADDNPVNSDSAVVFFEKLEHFVATFPHTPTAQAHGIWCGPPLYPGNIA